MKRILSLGFAIVGASAVIGWGWSAWRDSDPAPPDFVKLYPSPDGAYHAAHLGSAGGGISPWCHDRISVIPAGASEDAMTKREFVVYSAPCGSFTNRDSSVGNSPLVEWLSPTLVSITFALDQTQPGLVTLGLKKKDASGVVSVQFTTRD